MSDISEKPAGELWGREGFREDPYVAAATLDEAGDAPAVDPATGRMARSSKTTCATPPIARSAFSVAPGESIDPLLPLLDTIPVIALQFPAFNDGAVLFESAKCSKSQHQFKGELRAVGDVLIDQVRLYAAHWLRHAEGHPCGDAERASLASNLHDVAGRTTSRAEGLALAVPGSL